MDGVKTITNPKEPLYGEIELVLEEDLSIGNEDDSNYVFYRLADIEVDREGNIFILDAGNHRIQKFDEEGKYLQTIGAKGQGPGEFSSPLRFQVDGGIFVNDRLRTLVVFDEKGNYVDKGRIYVSRSPAIREASETQEYDIFSKDGYYLYKTTLPLDTHIIQNGFLYVKDIDGDLGTERVIRYKIKNWEQLKTGIN